MSIGPNPGVTPSAVVAGPGRGPYVTGVKEFFAWMIGFRKRQADACQRGVVKATEALATLAEYYTPIDTGELVSSQATLYELNGFDTVGHIQYTDPKAAEVHETMWYSHGEQFNAKHAAAIAAGLTHERRPQEQAKFLERPMREKEAELKQIITDEVAKVWM